MTAHEKILAGMTLIADGCESMGEYWTDCKDCPFIEFCLKIDGEVDMSEIFGNFLKYEVNKNGKV